MDVEVAFTGVPVSDLAAAQLFYERLLGRPADIVVNRDEVMWRLADGAWLYLVVDRSRAGGALCALSVGNLDATLSAMSARGVSPDTLEEVGDVGRKATLRDPDRNVVGIIEVGGQ